MEAVGFIEMSICIC